MSLAFGTHVGGVRRAFAAKLAKTFSDEGREGTPALDARLLVAHALGVDATRLALHDDDPVDSAVEERASAYIERRATGEPVARILGRCEFWGLELEIGEDTLVPRPDTETLVEAALSFVDRDCRRDQPYRLLDIGTGSGAIILALLSELPRAAGMAIDLVPGALSVARKNARRLGFSDRVHFVAGNWASAVRGGFDLVLSNPPYVESGAISDLQIEVAKFDPHIALDGGCDGIDAYCTIFGDLDRLLALGGRGLLEIGDGQAQIVGELAKNSGFSAQFHRDLAGIERVVDLRRFGDE